MLGFSEEGSLRRTFIMNDFEKVAVCDCVRSVVSSILFTGVD